MRGRVWVVGLAFGCAAVAGCVTEEKTGTGSTFRFETWIPVALTLGAAGLLAVGVLLLRAGWIRFGAFGTVLGLIGLVFGPGMLFDKAVVDDDHFELRTGFWFAPTEHAVRFDDATYITGVAEEKTGRRGRKSTSYYFVFTKKDGSQEKVPLGDLMKRGPAKRVLEVAADRDIMIGGVMPVGQ